MKQTTALAILQQGHHVFLTGQAGSGKTYLLNQYINYLHEHGISVAITASTGMAATHMNGTTIHSWAGIGIKDQFDNEDYTRLYRRDNVIDRLRHTKVLIIDEVSMLHARQLDLVDEVLQKVRDDNRPFGGAQVVLSGDFFQLPPIGNKGESNKEKFAFMAKVWIRLATTYVDNAPMIKVCYLSEQFRQTKSDKLDLHDILNQIRNQKVSTGAIDALLATKNNQIELNRTRLYTHNINVDKINQDELAAIDEPAHHFEAIKEGDKELVQTLQKNAKSPETLVLKRGAKVMFTKNNSLLDIYNGTMGEVVGFCEVEGELLPKIKLNSGRVLIAEIDTWSVEDAQGIPLASFSQLPLCLAWAITVHKSQGMTLDAAEIDLSKTFEVGQGYVALSRVRTLDGLKLLGLNQKGLQLDSFAQVANARFLTLSDACQAWFLALNEDKKHTLCQEFIRQNGTIKANKKRSTYEQTHALIAQHKDLKAIAAARDLSVGTIITHLKKLYQEGLLHKKDITHLAPEPKTLQAVKKAQMTLQDAGESISTHRLYHALDGTISYQNIDLARLFIGNDDE